MSILLFELSLRNYIHHLWYQTIYSFVQHSKSETSKKADIFGSPKSDDDEMFSSKPPVKEAQSSPLGSTQRKPVGGVSMFGGVDLFGAAKKSESEAG